MMAGCGQGTDRPRHKGGRAFPRAADLAGGGWSMRTNIERCGRPDLACGTAGRRRSGIDAAKGGTKGLRGGNRASRKCIGAAPAPR